MTTLLLRTPRPLFLLVLLLALAAYAYAAVGRPAPPATADGGALHATLATFHPDMLFSRRPVLLADALVDPRQLQATLFRYLYVHAVEGRAAASGGTRAAYTVVHHDGRDDGGGDMAAPATLALWHPSTAADAPPTLAVLLRPHQTVVLPRGGWRWRRLDAPAAPLAVLELFDLATWLAAGLPLKPPPASP
jgi:hypothetical protein